MFLFFATVSFFFIQILSGYEHQKEKLLTLTASLENTNLKLETANERLQELDLARSKFVSIASHQLRAPLTAIVGYSSMLLEQSFGKIPKKAGVAVEKIFRSGKNLIGTINDFLDSSTLEMGQLHFSFAPVDLAALVREVTEEMAHSAKIAGIELSSQIPDKELLVRADRDKIRHVIVNLIDNAIHYTPKGSIRVTLEPKGRIAHLELRDTGIGMSKETLGKIFGKFARGSEASKQSAEGVGLGLYLAYEIVKAHGGEIKALSEGPGKGSVFAVELPLSR